MDERSGPSKIKFHGEVETPADFVTKYNKEEFLQYVKEQVAYYGLQKGSLPCLMLTGR